MSSRTKEDKTTSFFEQKDVIFTYTSRQAEEDGILYDVDTIALGKISSRFFLKYITAGLLSNGYWNDRCKYGVKDGEQGKNPRCATCDVFQQGSGNLSCLKPSLNIPNITDLIVQAVQIFKRKPADDYFVGGSIELPSGQKQKIFIAQNETGRYTAMLPEES